MAKNLNRSQWYPTEYNPFLIEIELASKTAPYPEDGIIEYLHVTPTGVEIRKKWASEKDWNQLKSSNQLQRLVLK